MYRAAVRSQGSEVSLELELGVEGPDCCGTISDTAGLELFQIASSARKQDGLRRCAVWTGELKLGGLQDEQGRGARGKGAVGVREEDDEIYSREEG